MKNIKYKNSHTTGGITLIALVITIIILLILAGITIGIISGKNGIISKTLVGKNKFEQSSINETQGLNYLSGVIDDSQKIIPNLNKANTHFTLNPNTWTNESVTVTTTTDIEGYTLQTSKDASTWSNDITQIYNTNGTIYTRLINKLGEISQYASTNVTNIDKTKPVISTVNSTTNSITIKATDSATGNDGVSGIIGYTITTSTAIPEASSFTECTKTNSLEVTVQNLHQGTTYYAWVKDEAGNISASKTQGTENVASLTSTNTHFTLSPSTWTNGNVTVNVTTDVTGYTLQTSKDASTWSTATSQTLTENGIVYARIVDTTGQSATQYASTNVTNIEKIAPTAGTLTMKLNSSTGSNYSNNTWTGHNVYIEPINGSDGQSGHKSTTYSVTGSKTLNNQTAGTTLTDAGTYSITIKTTDNAGNEATRSGYTVKIEKTAPSVPTVTYNGGSNTCTWKNNYNITLSSSDNATGIAYYEIDWDNDGVANTTTGSNWIPWNGYSSCTTRFRAVDGADNRSGWTGNHHIHMDTQAPNKVSVNLNGYTSGNWTNVNVTQTYSSSDNIGIAKYQCSHNGSDGWYDVSNPWVISWSGQWNFWIRAIDHAGNIGPSSDMYTIRIDKRYFILQNGRFVSGYSEYHTDSGAYGMGGLSWGSNYLQLSADPYDDDHDRAIRMYITPNISTQLCNMFKYLNIQLYFKGTTAGNGPAYDDRYTTVFNFGSISRSFNASQEFSTTLKCDISSITSSTQLQLVIWHLGHGGTTYANYYNIWLSD